MGMAFATAERASDGSRFASGNVYADGTFIAGGVALKVQGTLQATVPMRRPVGDCVLRIWQGPAELLSLRFYLEDPVEMGSPVMVTTEWVATGTED